MAALVALATAGCGGSDPDVEPEVTETVDRVVARITATDSGALVSQALGDNSKRSCENITGEVAQIHEGAEVSLKNSEGELVATARLVPQMDAPPICIWEAHFYDVPKTGTSYTASIGRWESEPVLDRSVDFKPLTISTSD